MMTAFYLGAVLSGKIKIEQLTGLPPQTDQFEGR